MANHPSLTRRSALAGLTALLFAGAAGPAVAAVNVQLVTSTAGNSTKVYVQISGSVPGAAIPATTLGPLYVKPNGGKVTRKYEMFGIVITVVAVIVGIVLTVVTFGGFSAGPELFRRTVKKTVGA